MASTGYINAQGKYIRGEDKALPADVNITNKEYEHDMGRKFFHKEIIQPHKDGKPNPDFIRAYPDYSKKYFSQEVIDKTLRELP
jgi:hypothetical protein